MSSSNRCMFERLENRCLFSASVLDQVLGIATPASPAQLVFIPNQSFVFNAIPDALGTYAGNFTLQGGAGGTFTVDVTGQDISAHTVTGSADVNFLGTDYTVSSATGHVNLHGGFLVEGSGIIAGQAYSFEAAGHLDVNVTQVSNGGFEFTDPSGTPHIGHFSLIKTS